MEPEDDNANLQVLREVHQFQKTMAIIVLHVTYEQKAQKSSNLDFSSY